MSYIILCSVDFHKVPICIVFGTFAFSVILKNITNEKRNYKYKTLLEID
jgi:hypothetical protein